MACSSCGKRRKVFPMYSKKKTDKNYVENQDGVTYIKYVGKHLLRARGCASGHVYLFAPDKESFVDSNDFQCFKERWPEDFYDTETDSGASKSESAESATGISEGNGQVYTDSEWGLSRDSEDLEQ